MVLGEKYSGHYNRPKEEGTLARPEENPIQDGQRIFLAVSYYTGCSMLTNFPDN